MLALETVSVRNEMGHGEVADGEYYDAWAGVVDSIIFLESTGGYGRTKAGSKDALAHLRAQHEAVRCCTRALCVFVCFHMQHSNHSTVPVTPSPQLHKDMEKQASRGSKLDERHKLLTTGLQQRADKLVDAIASANAALEAAGMELRCFEALQEQEQRMAPLRLAAMKELVEVQRVRERDLQGRFKQLRATLDDLVAA